MRILQIVSLLTAVMMIESVPIIVPNHDIETPIIITDPDIEHCSRIFFGGRRDLLETAAILRTAHQILTEECSQNYRRSLHEGAAMNLLLLMTHQTIEPACRSTNRTETQVRSNSTDLDFALDIEVGRGAKRKVSQNTMRLIVSMANKGKTLKTIKAMYPWYQARYLERFRTSLSNPSSHHFYDDIDEHTLAMFNEARNRGRVVRGFVIRRWAVRRAREIGNLNFRASESWLYKFKRRNRINSRKVTKRVGRSKRTKAGPREEARIALLASYQELQELYPDSNIWNFDHSGFEYEHVSDRTLSHRGERDTLAFVDQESKATHSFTILPTISRDGRTIGKLLLCLQERKGSFGPRVDLRVRDLEEQYGNIRVICSSSGKMSIDLMKQWVGDVLGPELATRVAAKQREQKLIDDDEREVTASEQASSSNSNEPVAGPSGLQRNPIPESLDTLLIGDSWGGNTNSEVLDQMRENGMDFLRIPEGLTNLVQPLDIAFFRQYKAFIKRIFIQLALENRTEVAISREGSINLHSLAWNQFSAASYSDLIRYAWHGIDIGFSTSEMTCGVRPKTVKDISFKFDAGKSCEHDNCTNQAFIKCSHCGKLLCLHHFLERACFHERHHDDFEELTLESQFSSDYEFDEDFDADLFPHLGDIGYPSTTSSPNTSQIILPPDYSSTTSGPNSSQIPPPPDNDEDPYQLYSLMDMQN